jgi:hypothetical protein
MGLHIFEYGIPKIGVPDFYVVRADSKEEAKEKAEKLKKTRNDLVYLGRLEDALVRTLDEEGDFFDSCDIMTTARFLKNSDSNAKK